MSGVSHLDPSVQIVGMVPCFIGNFKRFVGNVKGFRGHLEIKVELASVSASTQQGHIEIKIGGVGIHERKHSTKTDYQVKVELASVSASTQQGHVARDG